MDILYIIILLFGLLIVSVGLVLLIAYLSHKHKHLDNGANFVYKILPKVDCGLCGEKNCVEQAKKIANGTSTADKCVLLKVEEANKIKKYMRPSTSNGNSKVAVVKCKGGNKAVDKYYGGTIQSCVLQEGLHSGCKECKFACVGCGDCVKACKFGAIKINKRGTAEIIRSKCTGCGECVKSCPNNLILMQDVSLTVQALCNNQTVGKNIENKCSVGCSHCGNCIRVCPVGAVKVVNNVPLIDAEKCIECYRCVAVCPHHVISRM